MKNCVILLNVIPDKKIKSIGNRCLININKNINILDYQIKTIKNIFHNPQVILLSGFEQKKIDKYIKHKYPKIINLVQDINEQTNLACGLDTILNKSEYDNYLIINSNHLLKRTAIEKIKSSLDQSFVLYNKTKGTVGIIHDKSKVISCYYGLQNNLYDILFLKNKNNNVSINGINICRFFFFEIINYYIDKGFQIKPVSINKKDITIIDNTKIIQDIKKYV